mmetsp:Transcript_9888/g.21096  ORF Transcript_9888/g.21096 Transcript_9888/m.21096 type:complete len:257 (+) Transcript_9888:2184-2954(+)
MMCFLILDQMPSAPTSMSPVKLRPSSRLTVTWGLPVAGSTDSLYPVTWLLPRIASGPPYLLTALARMFCRVTRLITRVTGSPLSAAGWKVSNLTYQSPVTPSHKPLIRSPVMHPSAMISSATAGSMASSAPRALLWTWMGPRYFPSPRMAVRSLSRTCTSKPFLSKATAKTRPPMPAPAMMTLNGLFTGSSLAAGSRTALERAACTVIAVRPAQDDNMEVRRTVSDGGDRTPAREVARHLWVGSCGNATAALCFAF